MNKDINLMLQSELSSKKQDVVISIRHEYAFKILNNVKRVEFRTREPNFPVGTRCWIYEPKPIGRITGYFIYDGCYKDTINNVWAYCSEYAGISWDEFNNYYKGKSYACAWVIKKSVSVLDFDLKEIGIDKAPQSYMYLNSDKFDSLLRKRL